MGTRYAVAVGIERVVPNEAPPASERLTEFSYNNEHYEAYVVAADEGLLVELSPLSDEELEEHGVGTYLVSFVDIIAACANRRRQEYEERKKDAKPNEDDSSPHQGRAN